MKLTLRNIILLFCTQFLLVGCFTAKKERRMKSPCIGISNDKCYERYSVNDHWLNKR